MLKKYQRPGLGDLTSEVQWQGKRLMSLFSFLRFLPFQSSFHAAIVGPCDATEGRIAIPSSEGSLRGTEPRSAIAAHNCGRG
jgi:hypothetical protein